MTRTPVEEQVLRVRLLREGGHVQRCHNLPHHGEYSVAAHSWHVAILLMVLHPNPSKELLLAALTHDVAERWTGDVPAPAKWASPKLKDHLDALEGGIEIALGIASQLTTEEQRWLKACDLLELELWCMDQIALGNKVALKVQQNITLWYNQNWRSWPEPVRVFYLARCWKRGEDDPPGSPGGDL